MGELRTWTHAQLAAEYKRVEMTVKLSDRKVEVLRLVAKGYSNVEISKRLYLSGTTVKFHLQSAGVKLGARVADRAHIVARAYECGVLTLGDAHTEGDGA